MGHTRQDTQQSAGLREGEAQERTRTDTHWMVTQCSTTTWRYTHSHHLHQDGVNGQKAGT